MAENGNVTREQVAERLLSGSVKRSYEPVVDIDWDAPLDESKLFLPERVISLYGTPLWESMNHAQRRELSRQELANVLSAGIWFENVLNRMLLRELLAEDPTDRHAHYALTEMGDECRHMVMFGRLIDRIGARPYRLRGLGLLGVTALPTAIRRSFVWVAALIGEEIFDALQRRMVDAPELEPLVSRMMRIHVTEEARHIRFAREALARTAPSMSRWEREYTGNLMGIGAPLFAALFTNRHMYSRAGLDGKEAKSQALNNPYFAEARRYGFADLGNFLESVGMMRPAARYMWKRWGFIA
ncbi:P-aminobenzoate N-oxygenase AurF [Haloechinothrix alba]|uniref:p-aminobenzoate N-oxygenase AurF n=1 Tax=Haloechinothrix alba TaxID=664784 RepID=A0A238VQ00_9PSEU|nr:diiron oxygenase [Haloechinothrix alba]SNR36288.1 P-aminobenzoate N-oxygenase AurF [Haloechinothrix alba]